MSLQCAISGEPLTSDQTDEIVVTPSGHICLKRLILTKLSENGGVDPFSDSGRPLSEDALVTLQRPTKSSSATTANNNNNMLPPPPPSNTSSFTGTLQQLSKEYDSVVLELFDTRKALQETRRELSQALYQNDAAIRVLARVSMERDTARQEAQQFQAAAATAAGPAVNGVNGSTDDSATQAPSKKKPRLDEDADLPLLNDIPSSDLDAMLGEWEKLHKARRSKSKTTYVLPESWKIANTKSWHKSTCRGLTAIRQCQKRWFITAGKDKQIVLYDSQSEVVGATFSPKNSVISLSVMPKEGSNPEDNALLVLSACDDNQGELRLYDTSNPDAEKVMTGLGDTIVNITGHPTGRHCCAATKSGKVMIFRIPAGDIQKLQHVSTFTTAATKTTTIKAEDGDSSKAAAAEDECTCGAMHPDGLLFATGTVKGQIKLWDLKNKQVGATFKIGKEEDDGDAVVSIAFSSNGYHFASSHTSGVVRVWDMRKNKLLAEINKTGDDKLLKSVQSLAFHPDAKHLAYAGEGGVNITTVKEWKVSAQLDVKDATGIVWDSEWIVSTSGSERAVTFFAGEKK